MQLAGLSLATVDKGESDSRTQLVQGPLQRNVIEKRSVSSTGTPDLDGSQFRMVLMMMMTSRTVSVIGRMFHPLGSVHRPIFIANISYPTTGIYI